MPPSPSIRGTDLLHGVEGEFAVHVCPACGAGNTMPRAGRAELDRFYPTGYGPHASTGPLGGRLGRALARRELRVGAVAPSSRHATIHTGASWK